MSQYERIQARCFFCYSFFALTTVIVVSWDIPMLMLPRTTALLMSVLDLLFESLLKSSITPIAACCDAGEASKYPVT